VVPNSAHLSKSPPSGVQVLLKTKNLDLLLHLSDLELMRTKVSIVGHLVLGLLRGDGLDLPDERLARLGDGFSRELELLLRLGHERRLDARRGDELRRRGRDLVRRDDELLERVRPAQHPVRGLDEPRRRERHGLRSRDQSLRPAVVALVELLRRARPLALRDDLLLRRRGSLDEPPDGVGDGERSLQDRVVHLHLDGAVPCILRLGHELLQLLHGSLDRPRRAQHLLLDDVPNVAIRPGEIARLVPFRNERLDRLGELAECPTRVHEHAQGHVLPRFGLEQVKLVRLQVEEEPQPDVSRCLRHSNELIRRLVVLCESGDALDVGEDIGEGLSKFVGAFDHVDVVTALFAFEVEVEGRCKLGGVVHGLFNHRERVLRCRVEVAGLRWRFQLIDGIIDFLDARLEDRV
jgi:hypothetical protein